MNPTPGEPRRRISVRREYFLKMVTLACSLGLSLAVVELGVRVFAPQGDVFKRVDPKLYLGYAPNARGAYVSQSQPTNRTPITINSSGYRGAEFDRTPAFRLVFLGDSYTVAMEVPHEDTFVSKTRDLLNERYQSVAAYNLGIDGTGTGIQLLHYREQGLALTPRIAILQLSVVNDFVDNSGQLDWKPYIPHWTVEPDGTLEMLAPEVGVPVIMNLSRHSQAAAWAYRRYRTILRRDASGPCWSQGLFRRNPPPAWSDAYRTTLALVDQFVEMSRVNGIVPMIVVVPTGCQLLHDRLEVPGFDVMKPQHELSRAFGNKLEIVDLAEALKQEGERLGDLSWYRFERDGHFNADGHAAVAKILTNRIVTVLQRSEEAR